MARLLSDVEANKSFKLAFHADGGAGKRVTNP